jgi:pilus assembly protein Flp/PilA
VNFPAPVRVFRAFSGAPFWPYALFRRFQFPEEQGEEKANMKRLILKWKLWRDTRGQDLIEYALMAGFVALAAAAIMPGVAGNISTIFSSINTLLTSAANPTSGS